MTHATHEHDCGWCTYLYSVLHPHDGMVLDVYLACPLSSYTFIQRRGEGAEYVTTETPVPALVRVFHPDGSVTSVSECDSDGLRSYPYQSVTTREGKGAIIVALHKSATAAIQRARNIHDRTRHSWEAQV